MTAHTNSGQQKHLATLPQQQQQQLLLQLQKQQQQQTNKKGWESDPLEIMNIHGYLGYLSRFWMFVSKIGNYKKIIHFCFGYSCEILDIYLNIYFF